MRQHWRAQRRVGRGAAEPCPPRSGRSGRDHMRANCQLAHFRDLAKSRPRPNLGARSAVPGGGGIGARSAVPWGAVRRSRARRVAALLMRQLSVNANCQLTHFRDLAKSRPRPKSAVPGGGGIGARSAVPWGAVGRGRGTVVETLNILSRAARRSLTVWGPWPQGGAN